ncbi:hypothetical protein C8R44DRAFT_974132 [Mycena epipterygia]|nr:hypothetical protein C8R44DRAFT_974132 [Mycena epipterygia]
MPRSPSMPITIYFTSTFQSNLLTVDIRPRCNRPLPCLRRALRPPPRPDADSKRHLRTPPSSCSQSAERLAVLQSGGAPPLTRSVFPIVCVLGVLGLLLGFVVLRQYGERVDEINE